MKAPRISYEEPSTVWNLVYNEALLESPFAYPLSCGVSASRWCSGCAMSRHDAHHVSQEALVAFLLNPASYPHTPKSIRLIQTHAAYVVLAPPYVYKVKKPVNLGFLDYSTLSKRKYVIEREIVLNKRLCSDLYLGVVPIAMDATGLYFGEGRRIVEYTIKMKRLSEYGFLIQRVQNGKADKKDISRIVDVLTPFYLNQTGANRNKTISIWGQVEKLSYNTDENFLQTEGFVGEMISRPAYEMKDIGL